MLLLTNHLPLNYNSDVVASISEQALGVLVTNVSRVIVAHLGDDVTPMKDALDGGAKSDLANTNAFINNQLLALWEVNDWECNLVGVTWPMHNVPIAVGY